MTPPGSWEIEMKVSPELTRMKSSHLAQAAAGGFLATVAVPPSPFVVTNGEGSGVFFVEMFSSCQGKKTKQKQMTAERRVGNNLDLMRIFISGETYHRNVESIRNPAV